MEWLPQTLKKLKAFDETLQAEDLSLEEGIGLRWADESMAYDQTPYDVLPFMDAGVDGIHVGLLTDFGKVADLEEAFVVCVHPMNAPDSLKILARNAKEFIAYLYSDRNLVLLYNFMMIESEAQYEAMVEESEKDYEESPELAEARNMVLSLMKGYMRCERVDDVYDYVESVNAARQQRLVLSTMDGIGVAPFAEVKSGLAIYPVAPNADIPVEEAQAFFAGAPVESKLAFIRDAQFANLINNETPLKGFIMSELKKMGCDAEVQRLKNLDW